MKRYASTLFAILLLSVLLPTFAHAWWDPDWTVRRKITIDTTPNGGAITDALGNSLILVRLSDNNFTFGSAKGDGSDIRIIAEDDKTPLTFHFEKFDADLEATGFLWVRVPDLKPNAVTTLWLYYGCSTGKAAPGGSDEKASYGPDDVLVYHFNETGKPAHDSSAGGNDSKNNIITGTSLIGSGLKLDGKTPLTIPASSSLTWAGGAMTLSAWVRLAALGENEVVVSRRDGNSSFILGLDKGIPFLEITGSRTSAGAPITAGTYHHLAVVASGSTTTLYVDGAPYGSLSVPLPSLNGDILVGADSAAATSNYTGFAGEVDELHITKSALTPGAIKLAFAGESGDASSKLITYGPDESAPAGWLSGALGLFGVILKSVTIDGWVVIGILGIMAVVSWYVMINKLLQLNVMEKGNALFTQQWRHVASDLTVLDYTSNANVDIMGGQVPPKVQKIIRNSPLYRIYHIGSEEISHRVNSGRTISTRSLSAIRASLDAGYVHEQHRLNSGIVWLTISIAGGPFMGLLGTCIGVMITFASIAATGQVDISAIAPGLAAALVATVSGLLVAIPALLGYNYLTSRMKTVVSDMQLFVDEFVTKMAEYYGNRPTP